MHRLTTILACAMLSGAHGSQAPSAKPVAAATARTAGGSSTIGEIGRRIGAARDGDTVTIGPGIYHEHLRIDKPISLVGEGRPVIDGGDTGTIVEITAPGVILRGFAIRATGINLDTEDAAVRALAPRTTVEDNVLQDVLFGIDLREASDSVVRGNIIGGKNLDIARRGDGLRLWRSDRTLIERNTIHDGRDAILWYSADVVVRDNTSHRCRYGFHLMYSNSVKIENNDVSANSVGVYLMYSKTVRLIGNRMVANRGPSGYGIGLKDVDQFTLEHNTIAGNRVGVYLDGSPSSAARPGVFSGNCIAYNDIGMAFLPSVRGNRLSGNNFIDNTEQVSVLGRGELTGNDFSLEERGNFWTDYVGFDQDRDGVGDFVHEPQTLFENMLDREPKLRFLLFSPVQQAVELVGRALPSIRPEPKFCDEYPLMAPVAGAGAAAPPRPSTARLMATGGLLVGTALLMALLSGGVPTPGTVRRLSTFLHRTGGAA